MLNRLHDASRAQLLHWFWSAIDRICRIERVNTWLDLRAVSRVAGLIFMSKFAGDKLIQVCGRSGLCLLVSPSSKLCKEYAVDIKAITKSLTESISLHRAKQASAHFLDFSPACLLFHSSPSLSVANRGSQSATVITESPNTVSRLPTISHRNWWPENYSVHSFVQDEAGRGLIAFLQSSLDMIERRASVLGSLK